MYKVSVILPNYNHSSYLNQRIESILCQTFQDFELIILDDCSTDNSKEIIENYRNHPKVTQIIYNELNSGSTFIQWKKGIELAKGEWIWIAESDDWCESVFLNELLISDSCEDKNIVFSFCQSIIVKDNKIDVYQNTDKLFQIIDGLEFVKKKMNLSNSVYNASMCIFRKKYIDSFDDIGNFKFCGDWLFWIKLALRGKVHISGKYLNYYRKHSNDVTSKRYVDGSFHKEYLQIQNYLLNNKVNNYKVFIYNLVYHYKNIKKFIPNKSKANEISKLYKSKLGSDLNILLFKLFIKSKLNTLKQLFEHN